MKFVFILYHRKTSKKSQNQWKNWFEIRFFISSEHHSLNCWKYAFFITELLRNIDKRNQPAIGNLIKNFIKIFIICQAVWNTQRILNFIHLTLHAFLVHHKDNDILFCFVFHKKAQVCILSLFYMWTVINEKECNVF